MIEQSGLFAEEGGYHINADNVHLKGAAIASTNPKNSELKTNKLTFEDIQNESQSRAISGGISGSANLTNIVGNAPITGAQAKQQSEFAKLTGTSQSNHLSPTVPMYDSEQDSSITKATLTEGHITLNKDSAPRETTAAELGINTDITEANRQVSAPKDIQKVLKEQQELSQAIGNIAEATSRYSEQQAQRLEQEAADAAQQGDSQTAKNKQEEAKKWQTGGEHKRKVEALTNAISLALAGKSTEAIATGAASPYINEQIKKATETMPGLNIPAHILWGAIEAELAGGKAATGAIAAGVGEVSAGILAEGMYGKLPNELTEEEKQNVLTLSKVAAGVASGLTANGNRAENLATISTGITVAENAVKNNSFGQSYSQWKKEQALREKDPEAYQKLKEEQFEVFKEALGIAADFTPILGDAKSFADAEDSVDYLLATVGIIPGADIVTKPLKEAKIAYQNARKAEKLGNTAAAKQHLDTANLLVEQSLKGIYDSKQVRESFEKRYGKGGVTSTTVPPSNAKNVKLAGQRHPKTGVPFDNKGFPIFDKYMVFDTRINIDNFRNLSYKDQMKEATKELANKIKSGEVKSNQFSNEQLDAIFKGKDKIPNYTWHHHQDTGRMQLINEMIHKETGHIGYEGMRNGK